MSSQTRESSPEDQTEHTDKPAPGWYTDGKHQIRRWWDGTGWTEVYEPPRVQPEQSASGADQDDNVALLGYGFAILMPVVGLLIGLTLIIRGHSQSLGVIVLSAVSGLLWAWLVLGFL